jgi:outer membrane lipoprotein SlyB
MKSIIAIIPLSFLFISCAQDSLTGDTYSRNEAGQAQNVQKGRITSIRYVKIEGGNTAGTILGGVAGGVIGNQFGRGAGKTLATVGGAGLGAVAGSHAEQSIQSRQGLEIQVRLDGGGSISVTQEANPRETFSQGERVRVLSNGGRTRITH